VRVHALDDAPYFVREGGDHVDLGWAFAGYVDPRSTVVDAILDEARRIDPQLETGGRELQRMRAVWLALEHRGLRYDAGDPALSRGPVVWSQRVRLAEDVWEDRRANCIDSSVLIAAVLERLHMRPLIVLVPQHAFVGYRTERGVEFFETPLIGASPARRRVDPAANFTAARAAGNTHWRRVAARMDGRHGPDYALIDVGTARSYGIIPFSAGDRSASAPRPAPGAQSAARERARR
jgi:hypothetical protein